MAEPILPLRSRATLIRRLLIGASAVLAATTMWGADTVHAQNTLISSDPADNASLPASPTSMVFVFADPIGSQDTISVTCGGNPFSVGQPAVGVDGRSASVAVPNPMPKGSCSAVLFVSAADGSPNGQFAIRFTITGDTAPTTATTAPVDSAIPTSTIAGATATTVAPGPAQPDSPGTGSGHLGGPLGLARLVTNLGLAVLLGSIILFVTAWPEGVEYAITATFLRKVWLITMIASVAATVLMTASMTGSSVGSALSPLSWRHLTDSTPGIAALARVLLVAGCVWVVARPERCIESATQLPALALPLLAVATLGFTRTGGDLAAVGALMGIGHALAMSVWFGGLVLLSRVVLAGPGDPDLVDAVRGFGRIATPALVVTVITGAVQTFRLDHGAILTSGHGRVLLIKALAVSAMVFIGIETRKFASAQLHSSDTLSAPLASRLRRATGFEALSGVLVLALTSWLVSFTPQALQPTVGAGKYGYRDGHFVAGDLDVTVLLTDTVGRNGVRIEVAAPSSGLTEFQVTFVPPLGTTASTVVLTVPAALSGAGVAVLDETEGVPLDVPGVWTLSVKATTPTGVQTAQKTFTLGG